MSRINDAGGYKVGNVYITTASNNCRQARNIAKLNPQVRGGVYCLYPGYSKPYAARYGRTPLGFYATESEARAAREAYMASHA